MVVGADGRIALRRVAFAWFAVLGAGLLPLAATLSAQASVACPWTEAGEGAELPGDADSLVDAVALVAVRGDPSGARGARSPAAGRASAPPTEPTQLGLGSDACSGRVRFRPQRSSPRKLGGDDELPQV